MLPTFFLKNALKMPQAYEYIITLCKNDPEYCRNNKQKLCKKILKISRYEVFLPHMNYCAIYEELSQLASNIQGSGKENYIAARLSNGEPNANLLDLIKQNPSEGLASFMQANGYIDIRVRRNQTPNTLQFSFARDQDTILDPHW